MTTYVLYCEFLLHLKNTKRLFQTTNNNKGT